MLSTYSLLNQTYLELQPDKKKEDIANLIYTIGPLHPIPFFTDPSKAEQLWENFLSYENIKENIEYPFLNSPPPVLLEDSEVQKLFPDLGKLLSPINQSFKEAKVSDFNHFEIQKISILKEDYHAVIKSGCAILLANYKGVEVYLIFPCGRFANEPKTSGDLQKHPLTSTSAGIPDGLENINLSDLLSIGEMLAFALPPPWGPFVAAGLMFFQFLFGQSNQKELTQLVKAILDGVKQIVKDEDDLTLINNIEIFSLAFDVKINVISEDPKNTDYMLEFAVPLLQNALDPSFEGSVFNSFEQILKKKYYIPKDGNDKLGFSTYQLVAATVMTISLMHKILLQIFSLVASKASKDKDEDKFNKYQSLWLGTFENWYTLLKGGDKPKVVGLLDVLSEVRSDIISARNKAIEIEALHPSLVQVLTVYKYNDHWIGETGTFGECGDWGCKKQMDEKIKQFKSGRISAFTSALDKLVSVPTIAEKTEFALKMWMNHVKPVAPEENTTVVDFSKSTTPTPEGKWTNGTSVRYAVKLKNTVGEAVSPWTEYFKVGDKAYPTLKNIPIDKHQLTQTRWIVRQFENQQEEDVGSIEDNTTTTWVDSHKG